MKQITRIIVQLFFIVEPLLIWVRKLQGILGTAQSSTPPLPAEHVGAAVHDPSLTTGEALDEYSLAVQKVGFSRFLWWEVECSLYFFVLGDAVSMWRWFISYCGFDVCSP